MTLETAASGSVPARILNCSAQCTSAPILLFFRGCAFQGDKNEANLVAETIAGTGITVVIPDCCGVSGSVFPSPLETGFAVLSHLARKRAGLGTRKSPLLVCGVESGGNLAAAVALKARDHCEHALDGQVLLSPLLDPYMGSASIRSGAPLDMRNRWTEGWSHYLSGGLCHPYAAPRTCSRLAGVAPALVVTSEDDPLHDETLAYAVALIAANVKVSQHILPAGMGWPSIYGCKGDSPVTWQESLTRQFSDFLNSLNNQ
ncbi:alpha/beta hydrolase fold domain-containing protein [Roseovarius sp. 217]|uniref:alpha/beta hydrolase fold domain-containing protein n=1 Tax=Roseovarius sp. (strain 217) TaxID=314264 RepID=UPI000068494F|nr:alpha/beta hydrolase [Roseovarius sp. 217]EAQ25935.1 hypothetical protein ROS217_06299 [Roseovarius sp. 217]